jgi:hypothetical protein
MRMETYAGLKKLPDFNQIRRISVKVPGIKFNESPFSGSGSIT